MQLTHVSMLLGILTTAIYASPTPASTRFMNLQNNNTTHSKRIDITHLYDKEQIHYDDITWLAPECATSPTDGPIRYRIEDGAKQIWSQQFNENELCITQQGTCKQLYCNAGSRIFWCTDEVDEVCIDDGKQISNAVNSLLDSCHVPDKDIQGRLNPAGRIYSSDRKINVYVSLGAIC